MPLSSIACVGAGRYLLTQATRSMMHDGDVAIVKGRGHYTFATPGHAARGDHPPARIPHLAGTR